MICAEPNWVRFSMNPSLMVGSFFPECENQSNRIKHRAVLRMTSRVFFCKMPRRLSARRFDHMFPARTGKLGVAKSFSLQSRPRLAARLTTKAPARSARFKNVACVKNSLSKGGSLRIRIHVQIGQWCVLGALSNRTSAADRRAPLTAHAAHGLIRRRVKILGLM